MSVREESISVTGTSMALDSIIVKKAQGTNETEYQVVTGACDILDMITGMFGSWERRVRIKKWLKKCFVCVVETRSGRMFDRKCRLVWHVEKITGETLENDVNAAITKLFRLDPTEQWIKEWMYKPPLIYGNMQQDFNKWAKENPFEMANMRGSTVKHELDGNNYSIESVHSNEVVGLITHSNCPPSTSRELIENTVTNVIMENNSMNKVNSEEINHDLRFEDYEDGDNDATSLMNRASEEVISRVLGSDKHMNGDKISVKAEHKKTDVMDTENNITIITIDDDTDTDNETGSSEKESESKVENDTSGENETRMLVARQDPEKYVRIRSKEWKELLETVKTLTRIANEDSIKAAALKRKRDAEKSASNSDAKKQTTMNDICDEIFGTGNE